MIFRQVSICCECVFGIVGGRVSYLNLVESVRTEGDPRQRLVLNFGDLPIDRSQYKALARRIEDMLSGRRSLFEIDPQIEQHAKWAAEKIFAKRAEKLAGEEGQEYQMDLTNTYFEGRCKANTKAAYGRSKEKGKRRKEENDGRVCY